MLRVNRTNNATVINETKAEKEMNQFQLHSPWKFKYIIKLSAEKFLDAAGQHHTSLV